MNQTGSKVKSMFEIVFDPTNDLDKRQKGADNLVVLAREKAGAEVLIKEGVVAKIATLMKMEKNAKIRLSIIRCIGELSKRNRQSVLAILQSCGIPFFLDILNSKEEETVNASSYVIQVMLDTLSDAATAKKCKEMRKNPRKMTAEDRKWVNDAELSRKQAIESSKELTSIFNVLIFNTTSRTLTGMARDAIIELVMKNCKYEELGWAEKMLKSDGYQRLMEVASEMVEYKHESSMEITDNTKNVVGICLGRKMKKMGRILFCFLFAFFVLNFFPC